MATDASKALAITTKEAILKSHRTRMNVPGRPHGLYLITGSRTLATLGSFTTNGDELDLLTFPADTYLIGYSIDVPVLDTHATPTIVLDVMLDDGTTEEILSDGSALSSTVGQTAGTIEYQADDFILDSDADDAGFLADLTNKRLALKLSAAAATDATDVTINFKVLVYHGKVAALGAV